MQKRRTSRAGFTLVEVIVTLVVLGILAGIGVPSMTGWIDETRAKTCAANRGSLLESYAAYRAVRRISAANADEGFSGFLGSKGSLGQELSCPSGGAYQLVGNAAITCTKHGMRGVNLNVYEALSNALTMPGKVVGSYDSEAPEELLTSTAEKPQYSNKTQLLSRVNGLKEMLSESNVKAWSINNAGTSGARIYTWTDQDINAVARDAWVRAYRYNEGSGVYTVGYVKVTQSNNTGANLTQLGSYRIIASNNWVEGKRDAQGNPLGQTSDTQKSFDSSAELFAKLTESFADKPSG